MPIYEYACQKCNAHIEVMQKISDKPLTRHVKCGGKLEKQWSQTSFQLKGAGWYVTDYANKKSDAKDKTEATDKSAAKEAKSDAAVKAEPAAGAEGPKKKTTAPKTTSAPSGSSGGGGD